LAALGYRGEGDEPGEFGHASRDAVHAFQTARGLRVDGVCGEQTWAAIVEAGYRLGDRRLYQRKPMMRGDDVADLQRRIGALGFDAGKVDGIYGPETAGALSEFQRNAGLTVDGIFGPDELQVLERLGHRGDGLVAELRELAGLRWSTRTLDQLKVVVAERGGLDALAGAAGQVLRRHGAEITVLHHPDGSELAQQANATKAAAFVELASLGAESGCRCAYYRGYSTASPAGQNLAEWLAASVATALGVENLGAHGMAIPVLRETRMPAVMCEAGPTRALVERSPAVAEAVADGLERWIAPEQP
jgi:N-acetylmuramoyl-L-alanine amidase